MNTDKHYLWHLAGAYYAQEDLIYEANGGTGWVDEYLYFSGHGGAYMHIASRIDDIVEYRYGYTY